MDSFLRQADIFLQGFQSSFRLILGFNGEIEPEAIPALFLDAMHALQDSNKQ
jgi:hypothetical protein